MTTRRDAFQPGLPDASFHDAEIVRVWIDRSGPTLEIAIETQASTERVVEYRLRFFGVFDLELGGINEQNVIFDLSARRAEDGCWQVKIDPSYGLGAEFACREVWSAPSRIRPPVAHGCSFGWVGDRRQVRPEVSQIAGYVTTMTAVGNMPPAGDTDREADVDGREVAGSLSRSPRRRLQNR